MSEMHWVDGGIIAVYMAAMLGIAIYSTRRQKSASEYLLASRSIGWFAIGFSLLASLNSAADYVVGPAMILEFGFMNLVFLLPVFISFPIIFRVFLPFYNRLRIYHCYEYLEYRFDVIVRLIATILFVIWRISWMGATIYLPAYVLNIVMGVDLLLTIILLGTVTTVYATLGGVRGVIWTDVIQAVIMLVGVVIALWLVLGETAGGWSEIWNVSRDEGFMYFTAKIPEMASAESLWERIHLYFSAPLTFWSIIILGTLSKLTSYGTDQVMVQRYLAARSINDCRRGFVINTIAYIIYSLLFLALGMALFTYFKQNPLPGTVEYEHMFPYFIGNFMPVAVKGLIIAAIFAAAQSSVSSGVTAATSAIYTDFYLRLGHGHVSAEEKTQDLTEKQKLWFARVCALVLGVCVTLSALVFMELAEESGLFAAFRKVVGIFEGLLIPIFLMGMFSRRVGRFGIYVGICTGFLASFTWSFMTDLGYGWNTVVAFVVAVASAYLVSIIEPAPAPEKLRWQWKAIMDRPPDKDAGVPVETG
jgi:SSS family solute:Na+ symporter